jgi:hypothetical protein
LNRLSGRFNFLSKSADKRSAMVTLVLGLIAILGLPFGYIGLCGQMRSENVERPPIIPFFILFGTVGGWLLGFAVLQFFWVLGALVFAVFFYSSALAVLLTTVYLLISRRPSIYHRIALRLCVGYIACLVIAAVVMSRPHS